MTVHIDEMTTAVEYEPQPAAVPNASAGADTPVAHDAARRAAEAAARRASRTRAEGFDD
jgi:hypothetical protein